MLMTISSRLIFFILVCCTPELFATVSIPAFRAPQSYHYTVDLNELHNDRLTVKLRFTYPPEQKKIIFCFPKVVPGIYAEINSGKHVDSLQAFDRNGAALRIKRLNMNEWEISEAAQIAGISYQVDDGWEAFIPRNSGMYYSAESSFDPDFFVLNQHNLFGFIKGSEQLPFHLEIRYPEYFYGATSLSRGIGTAGTDHFYAQNYRALVDQPLMYCRPDTAFLDIGSTRVCVAVYSTSGQPMSGLIAGHLEPLLQKQLVFLGGRLPVDNYTFLLHHNAQAAPDSYSADGLEHNRSTLILLNMRPDLHLIRANVYGIASHEFLHTLIPLALHSEQIHHFNFMEPEMSRHLWFYEGLTEYFTQLLPVRSGTISSYTFLENMTRKARDMQQYDNTLSLTYLSRMAVQRQDQYYNFYLRGALVNMCLDIQLRELSGGSYGVQNMVADLLKIYNKDTPFRDKDLFDEIARISYGKPVRQFFKKYVEGGNPPPLEEYLLKAGVRYQPLTQALQEMSEPSEAQVKLRKSWLNQ